MKYFSELTNKQYNTPEECLEAEREYKKEQKRLSDEIARAVAEKKAKEEALQASKKELAKHIEEATKEVDEATAIYDAAKEKATSILNEANKKANDILSAASVKVKEAEQKRYEAIAAFNKKFGPYTTTLTGAQAANAYKKSLKSINETFANIWNNFWK